MWYDKIVLDNWEFIVSFVIGLFILFLPEEK